MALASCRMVVRASWDTQQIQPYNRNAPRKINNKNKNKNQKSDSLSLFKPSTPTCTSQDNMSLKIDVDDLLNFKLPTISQEPVKTEDSTYLGYERWLPSPPKVEKPRSSYNAAALAYIGDCIYELYARRHFLAPALSIEDYNDHVMSVVRCEAQDALLHKLCNEDFLSIEERDILRWGKNITSAKSRTTKRAGVAVYNRASSLETLIGYLYLTNAERLEELMSKLGFSVGVSNQSILEGVKTTRRIVSDPILRHQRRRGDSWPMRGDSSHTLWKHTKHQKACDDSSLSPPEEATTLRQAAVSQLHSSFFDSFIP